MLVRVWRLGTLILLALSMAPALCHFLEMPAKMSYDGAFWLTISHTLYAKFGTYGGTFEVGAVLATLTLPFLIRKRGCSFRFAVLAAVLMASAHLVFWVRVAPANAEIAMMSATSLPPGWEAVRAQWEYGHAIRAVLEILALAALTWSFLVETPSEAPRRA